VSLQFPLQKIWNYSAYHGIIPNFVPLWAGHSQNTTAPCSVPIGIRTPLTFPVATTHCLPSAATILRVMTWPTNAAPGTFWHSDRIALGGHSRPFRWPPPSTPRFPLNPRYFHQTSPFDPARSSLQHGGPHGSPISPNQSQRADNFGRGHHGLALRRFASRNGCGRVPSESACLVTTRIAHVCPWLAAAFLRYACYGANRIGKVAQTHGGLRPRTSHLLGMHSARAQAFAALRFLLQIESHLVSTFAS
jgi:hypothetical protein